MKILNITTEVKYIPLRTPFKTALRETSHVEFVRVHVESENGLVGIGEAPATKAITGEDIDTILSSINSIKYLFIGLVHQEPISTLHSMSEIGSSAKAALDMAFVHLLAQEKNEAIYEYFGAKELTPLKTDVTISLNNLDVMLRDAIGAFKDGMSILKVKLGSDIQHAVEVVENISKELPDAQIIVDANQAWSLEDSLSFIESIGDIKIALIEQPVVASDIKSLKIISDFSHIPILADETVFTLKDAKKVFETKSAHMINIKLMKCGGVTKAIEILEYAREKKIDCMLGSMLEGPHSINSALHLAMAYRDVIKYVDLDSPLLYKTRSDELEFDYRGCLIIYRN